MRILTFSKRCASEILRDPLNLAFGLGFPTVLLLLLSAIQANVPVPLFEIERLAPGIAVFGLSFMTLFSATLIAKDRESAFLERLYTTPLRSYEFILGYTLPIIPLAIAQSLICYIIALTLGMTITINILFAIIAIIPISTLYISLGLLCGSIFNVKQVGGICGALLTNLSAWLSGVWFDLELVGDGFRRVAYALPFVHTVELERGLISGSCEGFLSDILIVFAYASVIMSLAIVVFLRQIKRR